MSPKWRPAAGERQWPSQTAEVLACVAEAAITPAGFAPAPASRSRAACLPGSSSA